MSMEIPDEAHAAIRRMLDPDDTLSDEEYEDSWGVDMESALEIAAPLIVAAELYRLASEHSTEASETGLPWYVVDVDILRDRAAELLGE